MTGYPPLGFFRLSVEELLSKFENKEILINKEYQRSYIWKPSQRKDLVESIQKGFSIGVLVTWINENKQYEILDGQQRIRTIETYCKNEFKDNKGRKFNDLSITEQSDIHGYSVYFIELKSILKEEQVSDIFTRLQEGTPLNIAEKVNALRGDFRRKFINSFENHSFYREIPNPRFRARLLAAQFLLLELETNFDKKQFPSMMYDDFNNANGKYQTIPLNRVRHLAACVDFLQKTLDKQRKSISYRDWISFYLLASYLLKKGKAVAELEKNFSKFGLEFIRNLKSFSIYDKVPPTGVAPKLFRKYMSYKVEGRKATDADSIKKRFNFILSEYEQMFPIPKEEKMEDVVEVGKGASYEKMYDLENELRRIIQAKLERITADWWKRRVPPDVRQNAESKKSRNEMPWPWHVQEDLHPIFYLDFTDYIKIIRRRDNWKQAFEEVFADDEYISSSLKQLEPIRIRIAHSRKLTNTQETRLRLLAKDICNCIQKATI